MPSGPDLPAGPGGSGSTVATGSATLTYDASQTLRSMTVTVSNVQLPDGMHRTFTRHGADPRVEIHDPLDGHKKLLVKYTDKDIHDVTAYLVTLK